jgi:hypothetical protein
MSKATLRQEPENMHGEVKAITATATVTVNTDQTCCRKKEKKKQTELTAAYRLLTLNSS